MSDPGGRAPIGDARAHALTRDEFRSAWRQSFALLRTHWPRWLATTIIFLIVVEVLTFVPYIGFVLKLAVASLLVTQWLLMCADADAGRAPRLATLLAAFAWPMSSQAVLVLAGLFPFAVGIGFLAATHGGWPGVAFFFGHLDAAAMPGAVPFLAFTVVMAIAGTVVFLVPGTIACTGLTGLPALRLALRAALVNRPVVLLAFALDVGFEALQVVLSVLLPPAPATIVSLLCVLAYVAWTVAFTYAVSVRALAASRTTGSAIASRIG